MSDREVWNNFLDNIKNEITNVSFDTWFNEEDTKFYSFKDNVMTITVNQEFIKKHIMEHYIDIMTDAINKVTNTNVTFNIILESEIENISKNDNTLSLNDLAMNLEKQSATNANLNPNYTFETFLVGKSNKFAYKAARMTAEAPGSYNPLFL